MLTGEDVDRVKKEQTKRVIVVETQQFFEIEIPDSMDPEYYVQSEECRKVCAERILDQTTDLIVERVIRVDSNGNEVS